MSLAVSRIVPGASTVDQRIKVKNEMKAASGLVEKRESGAGSNAQIRSDQLSGNDPTVKDGRVPVARKYADVQMDICVATRVECECAERWSSDEEGKVGRKKKTFPAASGSEMCRRRKVGLSAQARPNVGSEGPAMPLQPNLLGCTKAKVGRPAGRLYAQTPCCSLAVPDLSITLITN